MNWWWDMRDKEHILIYWFIRLALSEKWILSFSIKLFDICSTVFYYERGLIFNNGMISHGHTSSLYFLATVDRRVKMSFMQRYRIRGILWHKLISLPFRVLCFVFFFLPRLSFWGKMHFGDFKNLLKSQEFCIELDISVFLKFA